MYQSLYSLYISVLEKNDNGFITRILKKYYCVFFFYFCNFVMVLYYHLVKKKNGLNICHRDKEIIVSLTSYPKRTGTIWITIESLFRQSVKPDKILLWLADEQYLGKKLPAELAELQKRGLEVRWCDNLMSHKKYFYTMQEYPEALIVTADDDSFYPNDFIEKLYKMHIKYPKDVVCLTAQTIFPKYVEVPSNWIGVSNKEISSSFEISLNSGSGALFPPHSLSPKAFDKNAIKELCPYADDLWLTVMAHLNGTRISKYEYHPFPVVIKSTLKDNLCSNYNSITSSFAINNDVQWENMINKYRCELQEQVGSFVE